MVTSNQTMGTNEPTSGRDHNDTAKAEDNLGFLTQQNARFERIISVLPGGSNTETDVQATFAKQCDIIMSKTLIKLILTNEDLCFGVVRRILQLQSLEWLLGEKLEEHINHKCKRMPKQQYRSSSFRH